MEREEALARLRSARVGRLATVRPDGRPHVVPFVFALVEEGERSTIYWAVDRKPKRSARLQRLRNIASNPSVELVVDGYDEDWAGLWWVRAFGRSRQVEHPEERTRALEALGEKYPQRSGSPPDGPVVAIEIDEIVGWTADRGVDTAFEPLLTERLRLRRSLPEDAETISAYRSDPDVHRNQGWERTDPGWVRAEIEEMAGRAPGERGGWVQLSVEERESGRLVGDVGLSAADGEPGVIKIGYTMAPAFQGRGYGTEAVRALVGYAFDALGADVVRAYASADNVRSIRVAEKVGLRLIERTEHRHGDESWFNVRYELRREDLADR